MNILWELYLDFYAHAFCLLLMASIKIKIDNGKSLNDIVFETFETL